MGGFPAMTRKKDLREIPGVFLQLPVSVKRGGGPESGRLCPVPSSRRVPHPAARHEYQGIPDHGLPEDQEDAGNLPAATPEGEGMAGKEPAVKLTCPVPRPPTAFPRGKAACRTAMLPALPGQCPSSVPGTIPPSLPLLHPPALSFPPGDVPAPNGN